ncbi:MAG: response regulator [Rhodospirillaceae bacterium]|nr:response regulator [Rhodospirillaceae bacterium]MBT3928077.1 response regulator [Rhodospirillaceae bacterium]MBT4426198.1 response regulator [Rhodospirillaceae bacterium]MBT5037701.1 response regulator [Rhodospirillaceae bacterium]MBT5675293.1 response regulator [Rhodospirillaceae bacterium]
MKKTALIVEDNALNLKLMRDLLEASDIATLQTKDGSRALEMVREHRPDIILMDIQLPDVSGLDVTRQLKADAELRDIPIIAVTALALRGDEERVLEAGCDAYISKPISVAKFLAEVKKFLGEDSES